MKKNTAISSGWKGDINGHIAGTGDCRIKVKIIAIDIDYEAAWALCNLLQDSVLKTFKQHLDEDQIKTLSQVGAALGHFIDHASQNNINT